MMKVGVSVIGRFHAFYLAQQLIKRDALQQLITSYPKYEVAKYGIPKSLVSSILSVEILNRLGRKIPSRLRSSEKIQYFIHEMFESLAATKIKEDGDIYVGWSSVSLKGLSRAKELGLTTIVDCGSSHVVFQQNILSDEYNKYGIKAIVTHPKIVEKILREYEEADYISIPSTFVKNTFLQYGIPESKLIHIPYGVDLSEFKPLLKQDHIFRIIHCGSANLRKGCHYLLQAFTELKLPEAELWFVGSIPSEFLTFLKKYKTEQVILHGHQPQAYLHRYFSQASVFCLASIEEGLAMVQLQAMACGLPIICTTNTGGIDIVRDGQDGFVVPIRDVDALKKSILYLYEHPELRKEMGNSARQRVICGLTWDHYGNKVIKEYNKILKGKNKELSSNS